MIFDHIGIAVPTLAAGRAHLSAILEIAEWSAEFTDPVHKVQVQFGRDPSGICYETVAPHGPDAPVREALKTGARILNHVAYLGPDLAASAARLRGAGGVPAGPAAPAVAYGGKNIQFFVTRARILLELIEAPGHRHVYTATPPGNRG